MAKILSLKTALNKKLKKIFFKLDCHLKGFVEILNNL